MSSHFVPTLHCLGSPEDAKFVVAVAVSADDIEEIAGGSRPLKVPKVKKTVSVD
jgi:hypothetical protein